MVALLLFASCCKRNIALSFFSATDEQIFSRACHCDCIFGKCSFPGVSLQCRSAHMESMPAVFTFSISDPHHPVSTVEFPGNRTQKIFMDHLQFISYSALHF